MFFIARMYAASFRLQQTGQARGVGEGRRVSQGGRGQHSSKVGRERGGAAWHDHPGMFTYDLFSANSIRSTCFSWILIWRSS